MLDMGDNLLVFSFFFAVTSLQQNESVINPDFATFKDTKAVRKKKKSPEIQGNPLFFLYLCDIIILQLRRYVLEGICISKNTKPTENTISGW